MKFQLKKIHHLIRYFLFFGIIAFIGYIQKWANGVFLPLLGPPLYMASGLKKLFVSYIWPLSSSKQINEYGFLLPMTLFYFGFLGFQLKQLWNERGKVRFLSIFIFILFLVYVHFSAWKYIAGYFVPSS